MIEKHEHTVVIVGLAAVGKTTLAAKLASEFPDYKIIHADEYIGNELELGLDAMATGNKIVEGVGCYELLLHGLNDRYFNPDLIIEVMASTVVREQRCIQRGTSPNIREQDHMLREVWKRYLRIQNNFPPRFVTVET